MTKNNPNAKTISYDSLIVGQPDPNNPPLRYGVLVVQNNAVIGEIPESPDHIDTSYALNVAEGKDSYLGGSLTVQQSLTVNGLTTLEDLTVNGRVGIGTTNPEVELHVAGTVKAQAFEGTMALPSGAVMMWSGSIGDIPEGWTLCDGKPRTPDLSGRFIVGVGKSEDGYTTYELGDIGGEEMVELSINHLPAHTHGGRITTKNKSRRLTSPGPSIYYSSHNGVISSQGSNEAHENRPPYYALAFIMKL